jgi:PKD repeat protein
LSPAAAFIAGCSALNCTFADRSTDPDDNLSSWSWNFGDGDRSPTRDANHAFAAAGTYTVTLTAKDTEGATGTATKQVIVPGQQFPIGLTLTTRSNATTQFVDLVWTRGQGPTMYIYRNGLVHSSTGNDGRQTVAKNVTGPATYIFKVCEAATTICSNPATAQFNGGSPPPNAPPNASFTPTCTGLTCRFADGSTDSDGSVTGWQWNFGDGSSASVRNPSHTYASGGDYTVTLTATDNLGSRGSVTKKVAADGPANVPPTANFSSSCTGLDCDFTDSSTDSDGSVTGWQWDFGDGSAANVRNPSHTYADDGTYTVVLTVTDNRGGEGSTSEEVSPTNALPAADFTSSCNGLTCGFTDRSTDADGSVTAWSWSFGDGATSTSRNPSRTYAAAGTYNVTLRVTDNQTATHQRSASVTVTAPPAISLTGTGREDATNQYLALRWTGANGARVDVYQNGRRLPADTPNDGHQTIKRPGTGPATYVMKICETGSTTRCSNNFTLVFD